MVHVGRQHFLIRPLEEERQLALVAADDDAGAGSSSADDEPALEAALAHHAAALAGGEQLLHLALGERLAHGRKLGGARARLLRAAGRRERPRRLAPRLPAALPATALPLARPSRLGAALPASRPACRSLAALACRLLGASGGLLRLLGLASAFSAFAALPWQRPSPRPSAAALRPFVAGVVHLDFAPAFLTEPSPPCRGLRHFDRCAVFAAPGFSAWRGLLRGGRLLGPGLGLGHRRVSLENVNPVGYSPWRARVNQVFNILETSLEIRLSSNGRSEGASMSDTLLPVEEARARILGLCLPSPPSRSRWTSALGRALAGDVRARAHAAALGQLRHGRVRGAGADLRAGCPCALDGGARRSSPARRPSASWSPASARGS